MASFLLPVFLLILSSLKHEVHGDLQQDRQALLRFLHGLDGAGRVVNWRNFTSPCTSWTGVTCNAAQDSVQSVKLPGVGLYGSIQPNSLGSLSGLQILSLRANKLSGPLPSDLASAPQLRKLYLQRNLLSGPMPPFHFTTTPALSVVDLSFNLLSGSIPPSVASLLRLKALLLQDNAFTGSIPNFEAPLAEFNVSTNSFHGSIPPTLARFPSSSFSNNVQLCGPPLPSPCHISPAPSTALPPPPPVAIIPPGRSPTLKRGVGLLDIVLILVAAVASMLFVMACCLLLHYWRQRSPAVLKTGKSDQTYAKKVDNFKDEYSSSQETEQNKLVFCKSGDLNFDLEDLLRASAEVLGKGSFGTSYKAVLEDGLMVVVKRLKEVSVGRKEFEQHMDAVGRIRHKNLVPLRAYYYSKEEKLLVHDYMPLGSLASALHGSPGKGLDWMARLEVAIAAARGIEHVHASSSGNKRLVHGDIKSSNVLLHEQHGACVSDFALTTLFSSNTVVTRMVGYRAPEVTTTRSITQKSDVYSFGVVLLELLTGKAAGKTSAEEGMELPRWVQSVVREEWTSEVFDKELLKYENSEEEMVQMLQIALSCVATVTDQRPTMGEALKMMEDVYRMGRRDSEARAAVRPDASTEFSAMDANCPKSPTP